MPKAPPKFSVETVVVCDDVRHEASGKTTLVGIYNHNILLENFPSLVAFQVWVQIRVEGKGNVPIGFRLLRDGNEFLRGEAKTKFDSKKSKIMAFAFPTPIIEFKKPCQLKFGLKLPGKNWKTIKLIEVDRQKPPH